MAKRKQTMQWLKENRQYNGKRKQTIQWLKEN
jgi:post-segregation antitoxin (ccd killing protein)